MPLRKSVSLAAALAVAVAVDAGRGRRPIWLCAISCWARSTMSCEAQAARDPARRLCTRWKNRSRACRRAPADRRRTASSCCPNGSRYNQLAGEPAAVNSQAHAAVASGARAAYSADVAVSRHRPARCTRSRCTVQPYERDEHRRGAARPPAATDVDNVLSQLRLVLLLLFAARHRTGRDARAAGRPPGALSRCAEVAQTARGDRRDRRPRACACGPRRRRGRPAGDPLQRDARAAVEPRATRSTTRCARSASWSPTPRTSCARR